MAGPQFAHIQTWSMKANAVGQSIAQIIGEATRDPGFSTHVDAPKPPRLILGDPLTFAADHAAHVAARSTRVKMADGSERVRAIRSDRHTMASIVMSYPVPLAAIQTDADRQKLARWEQRNLDWLRDTYGDQLKVVMAHDDEAQPHLHAWLLPDDPGADATALHPGKVSKKLAEAEAKVAGLPAREAVKIGNRALKAAMTEWQNVYHEAVGAPEGLTRSGPKRRRLTREQWKAEKETASAHAAVIGRAEAARIEADRLADLARADRQRAEKIRVKVDAVTDAVTALADEVFAETIKRGPDGKITAAAPERLKPAFPELQSAVNAAADFVTGMKATRKEIEKQRADAQLAWLEASQAKKEADHLLAKLTSALRRVADFLLRSDISADERKVGRELVRDVGPLVLPAKKPSEEPGGPGF